MRPLEPPPSIVKLVSNDPRSDSTWKTWLNNLYNFIIEVAEMAADKALRSAFNEQISANLTPTFSINFDYVIHEDLVNTFNNNSFAVQLNSMAVLSTGAFANRAVEIQSKNFVDSHAGIGTLSRFSTVYGVPQIGSTQYCGPIDSGDGHAFGYLGEDFGIITRSGGKPEIRVLVVDTASSTNEDITVTLDGDAETTVTVTSSGNATATANEIAAHDFSGLGRGWTAIAVGNSVEFKSFNAGPKSGLYQVSASTVTVTFSTIINGLTPTEAFIKQTEWNINSANFDPQKGNIYQISYQGNDFGEISFYISTFGTGDLDLVHTIQHSSTEIVPPLSSSKLPIGLIVENTTNAINVSASMSSMSGFIEGIEPEIDVERSTFINKTITSTTSEPVLTLHSREEFESEVNRITPQIQEISISVESGKSIVVMLMRNSLLTDALFSDFDSSESVLMIDIAATAATGGEEIETFLINSGTSMQFRLSEKIRAGEFLTIVAAQTRNGTNSDSSFVVKFAEDF